MYLNQIRRETNEKFIEKNLSVSRNISDANEFYVLSLSAING